jgi:hypothetical protein
MDPTRRCPFRDEKGACALPDGHGDYVYHLTDTPALTLFQAQAFTEAARVARDAGRKEAHLAILPPEAIPMRLVCEGCGKLHIDEGEFATKLHHTHSCQHCGLTWRPAVVPTVGVQFLPGFKNAPPVEPTAAPVDPRIAEKCPRCRCALWVLLNGPRGHRIVPVRCNCEP